MMDLTLEGREGVGTRAVERGKGPVVEKGGEAEGKGMEVETG